jgi:uronate dehydrogenase
MKRVLITGAAGGIGSVLRAGLRGRYPLLRLLDRRPVDAAGAGAESVVADLDDFAAAEAATRGIDCVVHLAGVPREAPWDDILRSNIAATYNVFEAARRNEVERIVFASSNHVMGYYPVGCRIDATMPPRPDSRYGLSKVFGEALGRLYADKHGMSVACMRIGSFRDRPRKARELRTWISHRDMVQLVTRSIEAPAFHFLVVYGVSANTRREWHDDATRLIGYQPQDDAEAFAAELEDKLDPEGPARDFQGGEFCAMEFDGDPDRIP